MKIANLINNFICVIINFIIFSAGIPELYIPSFEPLIIPEITMNQGKGSSMNLQTTYRNLHMWGISQFTLKDFQ